MSQDAQTPTPTDAPANGFMLYVRDDTGKFSPGTAPGPGRGAEFRPRYKLDLAAQIQYVMLLTEGRGIVESARAIGVVKQTIIDARNAEPLFNEACIAAYAEGQEYRNELVVSALHAAATEGNVNAIQTWLYNRIPHEWGDKRARAGIVELQEALKRAQELAINQIAGHGSPQIEIVEDDNWYPNSTKATDALTASASYLAGRRAIQALDMRPSLGEDANGTTGGAQGARVAPG